MIDVAALLAHNQFASGGLVLGATGAAVAWARDLPKHLISYVKSKTLIAVNVQNSDRLFHWLSQWFNDHPYTKKARNLSASTEWLPDQDDNYKAVMIFTPAIGEHLIRFETTWIWVVRNREKASATGFGVPPEDFWLYFLTLDQAVIRRFFEQVEKTHALEDQQFQKVYFVSGAEWKLMTKKYPRDIDSVITAEGVKEALVADLHKFVELRRWYLDLGLPYRHGYLLYGPPGSGKSSLVSAAAGMLKKDLYVLSLSGKLMDDTVLVALIKDVPSNGVVLIEDIDAAFEERTKSDEAKSSLTFSGLLNALDGVSAKDGQVIFMSTNHIEKLDPALIRPGRVDLKLYLGNASSLQAKELFLRFFPGKEEAAVRFSVVAGDGAHSMAFLQNHLVQHKDDAVAASYLSVDLTP